MSLGSGLPCPRPKSGPRRICPVLFLSLAFLLSAPVLAQGHDPDDPGLAPSALSSESEQPLQSELPDVQAQLGPPAPAIQEAAPGQGAEAQAPSIQATPAQPETTPGPGGTGQAAGPAPEAPASAPGAAASVGPAPAAPPVEPLVSCGILVDGLVFDLPMPWGQPEFERIRASYLSSGGKKWLAVVMAQAMPYLSYIEAKVEEFGLPRELVFLPVIESEYSPLAVSSSGATGLWQFMRNSIKGYGLSISDWVDDRKDFMKSTDAALSKLEDNQQALGDWLLALAAYNTGLGAVSRAVKTTDGTKLDFWHLYESRKLSREPLSYVPKFLAVASILRYPELHGLPAEWGEKRAWEAVETKRQVDMNVLAEKAGIPLDVLKAGNAELRYHITPPAAVHTLKVPAEKAEAVRSILADDSAPLYRYEIYKVKSGDTLSAIAQRYGAALSLIMQSNPGIKADRLKIGQSLIIPKIPGKAAAQPKPASGSTYQVKSGDTLWSIALGLGIRMEELVRANGIDEDSILRIGQVLKLPKS